MRQFTEGQGQVSWGWVHWAQTVGSAFGGKGIKVRGHGNKLGPQEIRVAWGAPGAGQGGGTFSRMSRARWHSGSASRYLPRFP